MRRGRAAGRRGLFFPPARRVASSSQGLAPPPRGLRKTLGSPASPILGHWGAAAAAGKTGSGPGAAKRDRLGRCPCGSRSSTGLGRASRLLLHPLGPPRRRRLCGSGRRRGLHRRRLPPSARPERSFPGAGAAARAPGPGCSPPAQSLSTTLFQVCAGRRRGRGPRAAQVGTPGAGFRGPRAESREPRTAPRRVCLGSGDSPPLPPPLPPPAPSQAARAAPQGGSGLPGLLLCAATMVRSE